MKRVCLWLAVGFVFGTFSGGFAKPTQAQLDSLETTFAPPESSNDTIYYDFVGADTIAAEPFFDFTTQPRTTNYWIAEKFTPTGGAFTLKVIYYQVDNTQTNYLTGCNIRVATNNPLTNGPDTNNIQWQMFVPPPLSSHLRSIRLSDAAGQPESLNYGLNQHFWIMLGPVPGGVHPDTANVGDGWWADEKRSPYVARNYIRNEGDSIWNPRGSTGDYNWVLRAGGDYGAPPDPVINEVMFSADPTSSDAARNHEWVELYNPAPLGTVRQAHNWVITNGQGPIFPNRVDTLPDFTFYGQSYLVVHFTSGTDDIDLSDGRGDIYLRGPEFFGDLIDACALKIPGHQPSEIVDVVAWNLKSLSKDPDSNRKTSREDASFNALNKVVRVQPVNAIGPLLTANKGVSIGRDSLGSNPTTSLNGGNFSFVGGKDAAGPTPGRRNLLPMVIDNRAVDSAAVPGAKWTFMLYLAANNGEGADAQERWCYDLLNQIERAIPDSLSPRNVNVAVWFESRHAFPINFPNDTDQVFQGVLHHDTTSTVLNLVPIGKRNSGNPASLQSFINWAKNVFNTPHYVLALKGDGAGWEGLCGDADSSDVLEMDELKSALSQAGLASQKLDFLIFDAPLMCQVEVATQVRNFAHLMVASPEMTGPANIDYGRLVRQLNGGTLSATGVDSVADSLQNALESRRPADDNYWMWNVIRLDNLDSLLIPLKGLATNLKLGVADKCGPGAIDNFQLLVRLELTNSDHYGGQAQGMADFIDLQDFSRRLQGLQGNPLMTACGTGHVNGAHDVDSALRTPLFGSFGPILLAHSTLEPSGQHAGRAGISIYFPSSRHNFPPIAAARKTPPAPPVYRDSSEHSFDNPGLNVEGGVFDTLRMYARDTSACYPHAPGICTGDTLAQYYPLHNVVRDFDFVNGTQWDEFLIRYYKPVADAGPNPIDASLNVPVTLNASGSSDADDDTLSMRYFWDLHSLVNSPFGCDSTTREDLDKNCIDDATDDADTTGKAIQYSFQNSGNQTIWLHVWDGYDGSLSGTERRYQTAKDPTVVRIAYQGVNVVYETTFVSGVMTTYYNSLTRLGVQNVNRTPLPDSFARANIASTSLSGGAATAPTVIWTTVAESANTFPPACQNALNQALITDNMSVWICAPLLGKDTSAARYFRSKLLTKRDSLSISSTGSPARFIVPDSGSHFLSGLPRLDLDTTRGVPLLESVKRKPTDTSATCPTFPVLVADNGDTVAVARVLEPHKHAIVYSTFSLEQLADTSKMDVLMRGILGWLASPDAGSSCPCAAGKGDLNGDGQLTPSDVVLMLNCAFLDVRTGTADGSCSLCYSDVNCSNDLSPADVVAELNHIFLGSPLPCQ